MQRTAHLFSDIPANDTKESKIGHQNVSSPAAGIKPGNLAPEASMCANYKATMLFDFYFFFFKDRMIVGQKSI